LKDEIENKKIKKNSLGRKKIERWNLKTKKLFDIVFKPNSAGQS
jgi:hypothetical protein